MRAHARTDFITFFVRSSAADGAAFWLASATPATSPGNHTCKHAPTHLRVGCFVMSGMAVNPQSPLPVPYRLTTPASYCAIYPRITGAVLQ
jgi:hypothetical protein